MRVTVKVSELPSVVLAGGSAAIEIEVWASLSMMVAEAAAVPIAGVTWVPLGSESVTVTFSSASSSESSKVVTVMVLVVSPCRKVTEPVSALEMSAASKSPVTA